MVSGSSGGDVGMSVKVCSHCRRDFKLRIREDVAVFAHWVGDCYLVDFGLVVDSGHRFLLLRLAWAVNS